MCGNDTRKRRAFYYIYIYGRPYVYAAQLYSMHRQHNSVWDAQCAQNPQYMPGPQQNGAASVLYVYQRRQSARAAGLTSLPRRPLDGLRIELVLERRDALDLRLG